MLLSRFWYIALSVALAGAIFLLYLATAVTNRSSQKAAEKLLTAASKAVSWYLADDARNRATSLIPLSLDASVREGLEKASSAASLKEVDSSLKQKVKSALAGFRENQNQGGLPFDAMWAIDVHGRVVANDNFERGTASEQFEMGGYAVVADAIHGWIRDDAWVFDGQIYRVVARPVEISVGGRPVGCVVGAKVVDDRFAQGISDSTGAALAFYAGDTRVASGAPLSFDKANLEVNTADLEEVNKDEDYQEKGRTPPRVLRKNPGANISAIFARMPGEAWDLGAGYVVGHRETVVRDPFEFQSLADQKDKDSVPLIFVILAALGVAFIGIIFSILEHTLPLRVFRKSVAELASRKSGVEVLKPSTFRGVFKKIASDINDSIDKVAAKAGIDRGPADLESVLGPLPAAPQMSAFSVPKSSGTPSSAGVSPDSGKEARSVPEPRKSLPKPKKSLPKAPGQEDEPSSEEPQAASAPESEEIDDEPTLLQQKSDVAASVAKATAARAASGETDEETEWRQVYADFVAMKKKFGEPTDKLTYEKFRGTLQRNKDALVARHGCERVSFRVYEKQGKAALKASPVK